VKLPDAWSRAVAVFDEDNLVSFAGLAPVLALAARARLSELIVETVWIDAEATKVQSAGVNPAGKLTSIIAGMACGADSIDDLDVIRSGGMKRLFVGVYRLRHSGSSCASSPMATRCSWPRCCAPTWST
jgi:hypothetical protein